MNTNENLDRQVWVLAQNALIEAGISEREVMKTANTEAKIKHNPQVYLADDFKRNEDRFLDIAKNLLETLKTSSVNKGRAAGCNENHQEDCTNCVVLPCPYRNKQKNFSITIETNGYQSETQILNNKKLIMESLKVLDPKAVFMLNRSSPTSFFRVTTYLSEEVVKEIKGILFVSTTEEKD